MLAAEFNYTEEYADLYIDMNRLAAIYEYRDDCPPIGLLFKAFIGVDDKKGKSSKPNRQFIGEEALKKELKEGINQASGDLREFLKQCDELGIPMQKMKKAQF